MLARWRPAAVLPRLPGLLAGLVTFGIGIALMARSGLGLGPWEAFHQGLGDHLGVPLGTISVALGIPILALWWPLGERPGFGTLLNVVLIGTSTNAGLAVLPAASGVPLQLAEVLAGVVVIAIGSGLYLAADLGPGPRDGLMTGLHHRFGWSIRRARTTVELTVLLVGYLLGGTIGLGTVLFALGIGPLVQVSLGVFDREGRVSRRERAAIGEPGSMPGE
ncbi:MAG TPA: hypothetical protein VF323_04550 [Candidatus Limnocylindrales bacterium]